MRESLRESQVVARQEALTSDVVEGQAAAEPVGREPQNDGDNEQRWKSQRDVCKEESPMA
jgi:hypothetical protein